MRMAQGNLAGLLNCLIRKDRGVAVVEFALIVPIMLAVYLGCSEAASLLTVDRKVQAVAGAIGDLVARTDKSMTSAQMQDYFRAATSIMTPYDADDLVQTVTAVSVSNEGQATVLWSVQYTGGNYSSTVPEHPAGQPYALPAEMIAIALGQTVIAAETQYSYRPLAGIIFDRTLDLRRSALFMPRYGEPFDIN
jgi:Flp pilus assembly protein TadG